MGMSVYRIQEINIILTTNEIHLILKMFEGPIQHKFSSNFAILFHTKRNKYKKSIKSKL